jgi:hypothetical protein
MAHENLEEGHGTESGYGTYLEERFQGEVYGDATFRTMAERCDVPARPRKLRAAGVRDPRARGGRASGLPEPVIALLRSAPDA